MPNNRSRNRCGKNNNVPNGSRSDTNTWPVAGGVFSRLKIPGPDYLIEHDSTFTSICTHTSTTVPVTFRSLPEYVLNICLKMSSIKLRADSDSGSDYVDELDPISPRNQNVLIKGALLLAEAKVHFSGSQCSQLMADNYEIIHMLHYMAENLPKPLVEYLECIGVTHAGQQEVRPVLAGAGGAGDEEGHGGDGEGDCAPALAPCQLAPLLARLRRGVRAGGPRDPRAALGSLPLRWEEADGTLRLAEDCFISWVADAGPTATPRYSLRWDHEDSHLFGRIIDSVRYCKGGKDFFGSTSLRRKGSPAQFVQTPEWKETGPYQWFTMTAMDEEYIAKGAVFGFGSSNPRQLPSRFSGTIETSYQSGQTRFCRQIKNQMEWNVLVTDIQFGVTVPVTFSSLPGYVKSWAYQYYFRECLDSSKIEVLFIKLGLILAEAKVHFAQSASKHTTIYPDQLVLYPWERISIVKHMSKWVPTPLAIYLECIGNTRAEGQEVTPVLAGAGGRGPGDEEGHGGDGEGDCAPALAPCQLAPLLARLRRGVRAGGPRDPRAALGSLPLRWEEADGTLRLAEDCFTRWVADAGPTATPRYSLRWDDEDSRLFETTLRALRPSLGRRDRDYIHIDLTHGRGSPAQFIQRSIHREDTSYFSMTDVDEASFKLGAAFLFSEHADQSRFKGTLQTAYMRGYERSDKVFREINASLFN